METEVLTKSLVLLENATNRKRPPDDDGEEIFGRHVECVSEPKTAPIHYALEVSSLAVGNVCFRLTTKSISYIALRSL